MDIYGILKDVDYNSKKINYQKVQLEQAEKTNKELEVIEEKLKRVSELRINFEKYVLVCKYLLEKCKTEEGQYKKRRIKFLEESIDNNLLEIFPYDEFTSKIDIKAVRGKMVAKLNLKDKEGNISIPEHNEGKLKQQLIGFSSSSAISQALEKYKIYLDEAFAASSPENLSKISIIIKKLVDDGFQVFMIEQKDDIYKDLPRREFYFEKDYIENKAIIVSVTDY